MREFNDESKRRERGGMWGLLGVLIKRTKREERED